MSKRISARMGTRPCIRLWKDTPLDTAITDRIADGMIIVEIIGSGSVLVPEGADPPQRCGRAKPLSYRGLVGCRAGNGAAFDLETWTGAGVEPARALAVRGRIRFHLGGRTG